MVDPDDEPLVAGSLRVVAEEAVDRSGADDPDVALLALGRIARMEALVGEARGDGEDVAQAGRPGPARGPAAVALGILARP